MSTSKRPDWVRRARDREFRVEDELLFGQTQANGGTTYRLGKVERVPATGKLAGRYRDMAGYLIGEPFFISRVSTSNIYLIRPADWVPQIQEHVVCIDFPTNMYCFLVPMIYIRPTTPLDGVSASLLCHRENGGSKCHLNPESIAPAELVEPLRDLLMATKDGTVVAKPVVLPYSCQTCGEPSATPILIASPCNKCGYTGGWI
jgi:hypothetical protein